VGHAWWETSQSFNKLDGEINEQGIKVQDLFHTREYTAVCINLCVMFVKPFIFTQILSVNRDWVVL